MGEAASTMSKQAERAAAPKRALAEGGKSRRQAESEARKGSRSL